MFSETVRTELSGHDPWEDFRRVMEGCEVKDSIHRALYFDTKGFLRGLLKIEDRLTMAHSVESRVPLLDNEMIECALDLPANLKFSDGRSKVALREALGSILPAKHIERRKQGFTPPDATWFRGPSRIYVENMLTSDQFLQRGYFQAEGVREVLRAHFSGTTNHRFLIWSMLLFEWMQRLFFDQTSLEQPNCSKLG